MKKLILSTVVVVAVGVGGVALGLRVNGLSVAEAVEMGSEGSEHIDTVKLIQ